MKNMQNMKNILNHFVYKWSICFDVTTMICWETVVFEFNWLFCHTSDIFKLKIFFGKVIAATQNNSTLDIIVKHNPPVTFNLFSHEQTRPSAEISLFFNGLQAKSRQKSRTNLYSFKLRRLIKNWHSTVVR